MGSRSISPTVRNERPACRGSVATTQGIRVEVEPTYAEEQSEPLGSETKRPEFVFAYRVRISNQTAEPVRLLSRHWIIVDADGERREVKGLGVIGQQPVIAPGSTHEYTSFCPLPTTWGTMEGVYTMRAERSPEPGPPFDVKIARFYLVS